MAVATLILCCRSQGDDEGLLKVTASIEVSATASEKAEYMDYNIDDYL